MGSTQGSAMTPAAAAADVDVCLVDLLPVYVKELIAGGAAGAFSKTAVAPFERVKIIMQTRTEGFNSLGIWQSLKKLKQHEGVLGFFKGNGASVLRIVPYAALHFMTYEQYRCWILNNCSALGTGPVIDLLAGSAAGGTAVMCTYPLDLARTKLAYQRGVYAGSYTESAAYNPSLGPMQAAIVAYLATCNGGGGAVGEGIVAAALAEREGATVSQEETARTLLAAIAPKARLSVHRLRAAAGAV
ncbi:hypothetical protein HPP92_011461 [Vanilla planifolia]|uniref:Cytidine/deoxycytidylate deaminase zinc-binding domain-containing protein n=1 Tax=Vanilla planifolia TaxID=51239 RepID=A0A835R632_VANPL|nr:hypothetical protein HPP92_011461 [Vanilla planifolia]